MENLIQFILGSEAAFTPRAIVGIMVFALILEALLGVVGKIVGGFHSWRD